MDQRTLGHGHVNEIVEAVVEQDLGVEDHDHVDPDEHLEHAFVQIEVDWSRGLRRSAGPIEIGMVAFAPDGELHLERAVAAPIVVDIVLERFRFLGQILHDQAAHRAVGPFEQRIAGLPIGVTAETLAYFDYALFAGAAAGNDGHEIAVVHLRRTRVVHNDAERGLVEFAALVKLDRRNTDALAEDRRRVRRHAARHRAADIHHVPEHRREADQLAFMKHRHQHHKVIEMADRPGAGIGIVLQDDVAGLELEITFLEHVGDIGAELADDHPPLGVADHREFVVLLADHRRHRRTEQHGIHLVAGIAQRILDQVERNRVEPRAFPPARQSARLKPPGRKRRRSYVPEAGASLPAVRSVALPERCQRTSRRIRATPLPLPGAARRLHRHWRAPSRTASLSFPRPSACRGQSPRRARPCVRRLPMTSANRSAG